MPAPPPDDPRRPPSADLDEVPASGEAIRQDSPAALAVSCAMSIWLTASADVAFFFFRRLLFLALAATVAGNPCWLSWPINMNDAGVSRCAWGPDYSKTRRTN